MAWDQERHPVRRAGAGHGTRAGGAADPRRDLRVAPRLAAWDVAQRPPDAELEGGPAQVERHRRARSGGRRGDLAGPGREGAFVADDLGAGELAPELRREGRVVLSQLDGTDAARRRRHQEPADVRRDDRVPDLLASTATAVRGWSHPEPGPGALVEGPARPEARGIGRLSHRRSLADARLPPPEAPLLLERARREPELARERPLEVGWREPDGRAELAKRDALLEVRFEEGHRALDRPARRHRLGAAARAATVASPHRPLHVREDLHVLAEWPARGTGRATDDPGGPDGVDEAPVQPRVARHDRRPGGPQVDVRGPIHLRRSVPRRSEGARARAASRARSRGRCPRG